MLDVRWLKRKGLLRPGTGRTLRETVNGRPRASCMVMAEDDEVVLTVGGRRQRVSLTHTDVHFGGRRAWFVCSACGSRAAKLYGWPFRCRACHGIAYPSQRESPRGWPIRRLQKLREQLGGSANLALPFPVRPKGMHHARYFRVWARAIQVEQQAVESAAEALQTWRSQLQSGKAAGDAPAQPELPPA